jgi:chloramphenicol 3-O phosphotransferase
MPSLNTSEGVVIKVYFVGVFAPLEIIEEREKLRNTSPCGHARSHYDTVHHNMKYDLEIDTSKQSAEECADQIIKMLESI